MEQDVSFYCRDCGAQGTASGECVIMADGPCPVCGGRLVKNDTAVTVSDWMPQTSRPFTEAMDRSN